jgi:SP family arabinose:H+ symporter-like MFS transporter
VTELSSIDSSKSPPGARAYLALLAFVGSLGGLLLGFDTAVISGTIEPITRQFGLTDALKGWVVSSALFGSIVGAAVAGWMGDRWGRKPSLVVASLLLFLSAIGSMIPPTLSWLTIARFVGGVGVGMASMLSPLYLAEISPPKVRGMLVALYQLAITLGILAAYVSNYLLQQFSEVRLAAIAAGERVAVAGPLQTIFVDEVWRAMFGAEILPSLLFIVMLAFVPRSPRWLVAADREAESRDVLRRLLPAAEVDREIEDIRSVLRDERGTISELFTPKYRLPLLIGILLPIFSQVSGINAIIYYGPSIFAQAGIASDGALSGQSLIGLVNMLMTFVAITQVDRFGRRPLLIAGVTGVTVSLIAAGTLFATMEQPGAWLIPAFLLHVGCFAFSLGPCVWVVISEIFPTRIRGQAMSIATLSVWVSCLLVGQLFPVLNGSLGPAAVFFIFAALIAPALPFVLFVLPETKGRSLEDIERSWGKRARD